MLKPSACKPCVLYTTSHSFSRPELPALGQDLGVTLIGEGLGGDEAIDGLPFRPHAEAGSKLEEAFRLTGFPRERFKLWNLIGCQPPGNRLRFTHYEDKAIRFCRQAHFDGIVPPGRNNVILALGALPMQWLTKFSGIESESQSISYMRGYVLNSPYGLVIPTYHPSFLKRGSPQYTPYLVEDLKKAVRVAGKGKDKYDGDLYPFYPQHREYAKPDYQLSPSYDDAVSFYYKVKDGVQLTLSYDIETPEITHINEDLRDKEVGDSALEITQIQFSTAMGEAIAMPWRDPYLKVIRGLLKLPNTKANHNAWNFDNVRLRAIGTVLNGHIHDTMWMFKHWQPELERHLQSVASLVGFPFPWKHMAGANLRYYGCADVDAVQYILTILPDLMRKLGVWRGYKEQVFEIHTIQSRASDRGIPVSEEKLGEVKKGLQARLKEVSSELQEAVPDEVKNITPRKKRPDGQTEFGYVRTPKPVTEALAKVGGDIPYEVAAIPKPYVLRTFRVLNLETNEIDVIQRWCKLSEFKPSSQQVIKYLRYKQKTATSKKERAKYEVPRTLRDKKPTTAKDELSEIFERTDDVILELCLEHRSVQKMLNNDIKNWQPGKDGRVHTTWYHSPPQGQFASRRPNVQNCSKHTPLGQLFRGALVAPAGYSFVEFDYRSFHVAMLGYVAESKEYLRFSQLDPHSIFTSWIMPSSWAEPIDMSWSDGEIMELCKWIKRKCKREADAGRIDIRQKQGKPTVLGNQLGLGPRKLYRQNRRHMTGIKQAEGFQAKLKERFAEVEAAKERVREDAHYRTYLTNEWGYIQHFFEVFRFKWDGIERKWNRNAGAYHDKVLAFWVQCPSFGMIKDKIRQGETLGYNEEYGYINTIHDSTVFLVEDGKREKCIEDEYRLLVAPCERLKSKKVCPEGLSIAVEVSVGKNQRSWDPEGNGEGMREIKV